MKKQTIRFYRNALGKDIYMGWEYLNFSNLRQYISWLTSGEGHTLLIGDKVYSWVNYSSLLNEGKNIN
tara:strand:+ start:1060 stop:1263 length:204 start_codon:yes stop_codon:yes gene_type:complete